MQIKTTRYRLSFIRMTVVKQKGILNIEQDVEEKGATCELLMGMYTATMTMEKSVEFSQK